jgi:hypothetical protein
MTTNEELLLLLSRQEVIESNHKATVHDQTLCNDRIYGTIGNAGRWMMNTFVRSKDTGGRNEVCTHIEWLVLAIDSLATTTCLEHQQCEKITSRLLLSIGRLMETYPMDQTSHVDEVSHPYRRLENCMVRLLLLNGNTETHV